MSYSSKARRAAPYRHTGRRSRSGGSPLMSALFFPAAILYHELLLRAFDRSTPFFDLALLRILLFSLAAGLLLFLILDLLPWKAAARIAGGVMLGLGAVLFCVERGCRATFNLYYGLGFMGGMAGDVTGDFGSTVASVVLGLIPFILLSFVPLAVYVLLRNMVFQEEGQENLTRIILAVGLVIFQLGGWALSAFGAQAKYYTYEYTANVSIPHFGVVTSLRLELEYAVAGIPAPPLGEFIDPVETPDPSETGRPEPSADPSADPSSDPVQKPVPTGPNTLAIDFNALAESESNQTIQNIHQYLASLTPSEKNQYTGMFKGKNLILLTAEGFSPYAIDQELTPTLYKLTHEGFVFNNFYQPDWTQSTCGGEFAVTTGIIPNWVNGGLAANASAGIAMPNTLAKLFAAEGYAVPAWHNHTYTYYGRDKYLGNYGYDYKGIGNGLELPHTDWPNSDLEMMEATVDSYINGYVQEGKPFHAYYMTVSGHGYYSWGGNAMSRKHREAVERSEEHTSELQSQR